EMGNSVWLAHDHQRRQAARLGVEQMVERHHHLLGVQPQLAGDLLHGVDRRAVEIDLAGLPQAAVAHRAAEAFEQRFERRGTAIHLGGLDHLRREERSPGTLHEPKGPPPPAGTAATAGRSNTLPTVRNTSTAGETRSTSTSTVAGSPCWNGRREPRIGWASSSTRMLPPRGSLATRATVAARSPNWMDGNPTSRTRARWFGRMRPSASAGENSAITRKPPSGTTLPSNAPGPIT